MSTLNPQLFVANWANTQLKESASYITHFDDLCELVGYPKPAHADKTGETFTYQKGVMKNAGGQDIGRGFADVWHRGRFAVEYKSARKYKTLSEALKQLQGYCGALENPPLLMVCDIEHYEIYTNFNGAVTKIYRFSNADIASPRDVPGTHFTAHQVLHHLFHDPEALRPQQTITSVTEDAARRFADLSESIHRNHPRLEQTQIARFLVKLVFCLFCEDVGLLPNKVFARMVEKTKGSDKFTRSLRDLFRAMASGGDVWGEDIPYFDGGLFYANDDEQDVIDLDGVEAQALLAATSLNWADVDPTIFGSLFERALEIEDRRAELGAHYTSRSDIETIVEPVLMRPLRAEWGEIKLSAEKRAASGQAKSAIKQLLAPFLDRLAALKVLDPACGSGNFLYVSLTLLKDLEQEVIALARNLGLDEFSPRVTPAQLYGLEKDEFAYQLASVVVWIGYLQWKAKNGYDAREDTPILRPLNNIQHMDAIMTRTPNPPLTPPVSDRGRMAAPAPVDAFRIERGTRTRGEGVAYTEPDWPPCDIIVGNPPFLGGKKMRAELGDAYVSALFELYEGRVAHEADLVCYWFEKARAMIAEGKVKRAGLLATNSIRGGANREVLKRIKETGDIFWAQSSRDWILDGAAVDVSMIGFDNGADKTRVLDDAVASNINSDLTAATDLTTAQRLKENLGIAYMGDTKGGSFDIPSDVANWMLSQPNPHKKPNSNVIFRWVNGLDVTRRPREMWIIDFGVDMSQNEAALYEAPFGYVAKHVKPERLKNNRATYRDWWWIHVEPRPALREKLTNLNRYIATPTIAKHRLFVFIPADTLPDHQLIAITRDDDYFFGVLQSRIHEVWALRQGTSLEDRPRYTPTTTFETFPFPWPPGQEPSRTGEVTSPLQHERAIAQAAQELNTLRDNWLNPYKDQPSALDVTAKKRTLTNLYNDHPTWLQLAHRKLDDAVLDAYGWPHDLSDDDILARLLALNLERANRA